MRVVCYSARMNTRVYLDYAAATPVAPEVMVVMLPYFSELFGNAGAVHAEGRAAREAIDEARTQLARILTVRPEGITFTSGGTEANNLAIFGTLATSTVAQPEVITTEVEHPSVLEAMHELEKRGVKVTYLPVQESGLVDKKVLAAALTLNTVLVTFAYANSETGVVQDVRALVRTVQEFARAHAVSIRTHIDASQAPLWLPLGMDALGADMMTLDAGKCYGPKGLGVLARKHGAPIVSQTYGGQQEAGLRAGTENTPLILGGAAAFVRAEKGREERVERTRAVRDYLLERLQEIFPNAVLNGAKEDRLANNVNISLPGMDTEYAVMYLDAHGIAVSTRSACGALGKTGSHVIRAMTHDEERATATLRVTLGEVTTRDDVDACVTTLQKWHDLMQRVV